MNIGMTMQNQRIEALRKYATPKQSFIVYVKSEDVFADLAGDFEHRFDTSNYKVERPLPIGENKKVISLIEYELDGKIMKVFVALRPNVYRYLSENECEAGFDLTFQKRSVSFPNENNAKLILNIARYGWIGDKENFPL